MESPTITVVSETLVEGIYEEIRAFLLMHREEWYKVVAEMPEIKWNTLLGFCQQHKRCLNPTLHTLAEFERACRLIDPEFLQN